MEDGTWRGDIPCVVGLDPSTRCLKGEGAPALKGEGVPALKGEGVPALKGEVLPSREDSPATNGFTTPTLPK